MTNSHDNNPYPGQSPLSTINLKQLFSFPFLYQSAFTSLLLPPPKKCVLYWPEKRGIYGKVEVLVNSVEECENYTVRNLTLKNVLHFFFQQGSQSTTVKHYWYTSWPDHKTPDSAQPLLQLMLDVEEDRLASAGRGPVVVHCSAGIGRTGCFIATAIGCHQLKEEGVVDALSIVCQLRLDRRTAMGVVRGKMETRFHVLIFTCLAFEISGGFLIIHELKQQCVYESNTKVHVEKCNITNLNQQWRWMKHEKLLHVRSGQCLAFNRTSAAHSRRAVVANCSEAPRWTCHGKEGLLEVKNNSLFLKKQGTKVVVKIGRKYPDSWKKIEINKSGELVHQNLCSK
ncbi:hypothetical protein lerEdw1_021031, partial [Lerista edwardsae]